VLGLQLVRVGVAEVRDHGDAVVFNVDLYVTGPLKEGEVGPCLDMAIGAVDVGALGPIAVDSSGNLEGDQAVTVGQARRSMPGVVIADVADAGADPGGRATRSR